MPIERLKFYAILFGAFAVGLLSVTFGVWALLHPSKFVRMNRYRGLKEKDLDSIGGRLKILVQTSLFPIGGSSLLTFAGTLLYLQFGGKE